MKHFQLDDIKSLERFYRANLINAVSGYKPAHLVGTVSASGVSNLAIFSSVVHLGADPALLGMVVRPDTVPRHTYENIVETHFYTINHVHESFVEKAHFTSANFDKGISEFTACRLTEEYRDGFAAPYVKESSVKIGMRFVEAVPVRHNGTIFVIGAIEHIYLPEEIIAANGNLKLDEVRDVCVSGLESYGAVRPFKTYPYARVRDLPDFRSHE